MTLERQFGPRGDEHGGTIFGLWAPAARTVDLVTSQVTPMRRLPAGWYEIEYPAARAGSTVPFGSTATSKCLTRHRLFNPRMFSGRVR